MKKKILVCIVFFIACFLNLNTVIAKEKIFDTGTCIDGFGKIAYDTSSWDKTPATGDFDKINFSNEVNLKKWNGNLKSFSVEVVSKKDYKINKIIYRVSSKDGYSCNGVFGRSNGKSLGYSKVMLDVEISKEAWVDDISFYAEVIKYEDGQPTGETEYTSQELIKVKYNNITNIPTTSFETDKSITCQFLEDVFGEYWNWVLILAPVATMILITIDFVGCLLSSDAEALKKAGDKTIKRTIALVLLLMLPIVLKLIFNLFGLDICG